MSRQSRDKRTAYTSNLFLKLLTNFTSVFSIVCCLAPFNYQQQICGVMTVTTLEELMRLKVISQDAYDVGDVTDLRYDAVSWAVEGLRVKCTKDVSNIIGAGSSKSMILIRPPTFHKHDVILLPDTVEESRAYIRADSDALELASNLIGKKVYSCDHLVVGVIDEVNIDISDWMVHSFIIKLDKTAHDLLGIKKGLGFMTKAVSGINVGHVATVAENMSLNLTIDQVRDVVAVV